MRTWIGTTGYVSATVTVGTRVKVWKRKVWLCVKLVINIYFLNTECCVFITYKKET